jgi:3-deoxy-7-phosphoheptulonate synthase
MKIPTGTEFLDSIIPQYISDLISWGAIGARTTESQVHRELASGLSAPIGFKNGTNGNVDIAIDAIRAASFSHHFLGVTKNGRAAIVNTKGNDSCHIILRGASTYTNYDKASIEVVVSKLSANGLVPKVMIDCSHGNSCKNHKNQKIVVHDIANQISKGSESILGVMIESHITEGKQSFDVGQNPAQNKSVTDACISWEETEKLLHVLSEAQNNNK